MYLWELLYCQQFLALYLKYFKFKIVEIYLLGGVFMNNFILHENYAEINYFGEFRFKGGD